MKPVPSIRLQRLGRELTVNGAPSSQLTTDSSALHVFEDFDRRQPMILEQGVSVDDAAYLLRITHAKHKLVVDKNERLRGLVSLRDIDSVKVLATASAMGVSRADLTVKDIMAPVHRLQSIDKKVLDRATVGDLVEAMEFESARYLMVLDAGELRGMVCADEIAHRLGQTIDVTPVAKSFNEVFSALHVKAAPGNG